MVMKGHYFLTARVVGYFAVIEFQIISSKYKVTVTFGPKIAFLWNFFGTGGGSCLLVSFYQSSHFLDLLRET